MPTKNEYPGKYDYAYDTRRGSCEPARVAAITDQAARDEKAKVCRDEAESHRLNQEGVNQAARQAEAAEEGLQYAEQQTRIAYIQALLSVFAVVFTGWAAREAARAARAAQDSVEDARKDAAEQANRFDAQLAATREIVNWSAKSALAMDDSARAMGRAARAAAKNADVAERALTVVERAYVFGGVQDLDMDEATAHASFRISLLNAGRTPARIRMIRFGVIAHAEITPPELNPVPDYSSCLSFPQDTIFTAGQFEGVVRLPTEPPWGIVFGMIEYDDIFGKPHKSRFCISYNGPMKVAVTYGNEAWNAFD